MKNQKSKHDDRIQLFLGNNLESLSKFKDNSIHAVVIDGPYGMNSKEYNVQDLAKQYLKGEDYLLGGKGIVGMDWDSDLPTLALAKELLRVLKPGGFLVCFTAGRTYDILVFTMRWAGFLIKDQMIWAYSSGVPKGQWLANKAVDEIEASRLKGLNPALKPAIEPMVLAQKPLSEETILANFRKHGTGALNIGSVQVTKKDGTTRYPANIVTDGTKVVTAGFSGGDENFNSCPWSHLDSLLNPALFYSKAQPRDRDFGLDEFKSTEERATLFSGNSSGLKNIHPTVKPIALMRHLVRLVSRPGDIVLDCFMGSGSTGCAAILEGRVFVGMEINKDYFEVSKARINRTKELMDKYKVKNPDHLILLAELDAVESEMQGVADKIIKDPNDLEAQKKLQKLESIRKKLLSKFKKPSAPIAA